MWVWDDGTVTGSVNEEQLIAEHPDHPVTKRILADREEKAGRKAARSESEPEADDPFEGETVDSLKDQLRERDLPTSGNKAELIERLREADGEEE